MQSYDPYQAPVAPGPAPLDASSDARAAIVEAMRQTKPWVTFLSVLGFLSAALMALVGIVMSLVGSVASQVAAAGPFEGFGALIGIAYVVLGAFYVVPSWLLWRYAASIGAFVQAGTLEGLAEAVDRQKSFWRFAGIFTLVIIGLYLAAIFLGVVAALATAAGR